MPLFSPAYPSIQWWIAHFQKHCYCSLASTWFQFLFSQALAMGMMTEYYHYIFTTLVSYVWTFILQNTFKTTAISIKWFAFQAIMFLKWKNWFVFPGAVSNFFTTDVFYSDCDQDNIRLLFLNGIFCLEVITTVIKNVCYDLSYYYVLVFNSLHKSIEKHSTCWSLIVTRS